MKENNFIDSNCNIGFFHIIEEGVATGNNVVIGNHYILKSCSYC